MKRISFIFIIFISSILLFCINSNAYDKYLGVSTTNEINYIAVRYDEEDAYEYNLKNSISNAVNSSSYNSSEISGAYIGTQFKSTINNNKYYLFVFLEDNGNDSYYIEVFIAKDADYVSATNDFLSKYYLFKGAYINDELNYSYRDTIYIPSYTGLENDIWIHTGAEDHYIAGNCNKSSVSDLLSDIEDEFFNFIIMYNFTTNSVYQNKLVYYLVDYEHQVSSKTIINSIKIMDETKGNITSSMIVLKNNYINDGTKKLGIGQYNLIVGGYDDSLNAVKQKIIIKVCDINAPIITKKIESIDRTYMDSLLDEEYIKKNVTVTDNLAIKNISINMSDYISNYNKVGKYYATITATDTDNNVTVETLTINVNDKVGPNIVGLNRTSTNTKTPLKKSQILALIKIHDDVDGDITNVDIVDSNNYFNNTGVVGSYRFDIIAPDKAGNECQSKFYVDVTDEDLPTISVNSNYVLSLAPNESLTKEAIISIFQLNSERLIVDLSSNYFSEDFPVGEYSVYITLEDGSFEEGLIKVQRTEINKQTNKESNNYYIYIAVASIVLLLGLGYFIYRQLKNRR